MTELVRNWVLGLTGTSFLTAIAMALTPKGRVRAMTGLVAGLVTIVALISPVLDFDYLAYTDHLSGFEVSLDLRIDEMQASQERLQARLISERSATYILDKAESVGLVDLDVTVQMNPLADGTFYPYAVFLYGVYTEEQRRTLEAYLSGTFGIPLERQIWSVADA